MLVLRCTGEDPRSKTKGDSRCIVVFVEFSPSLATSKVEFPLFPDTKHGIIGYNYGLFGHHSQTNGQLFVVNAYVVSDILLRSFIFSFAF